MEGRFDKERDAPKLPTPGGVPGGRPGGSDFQKPPGTDSYIKI
jgi:hypothetical protein